MKECSLCKQLIRGKMEVVWKYSAVFTTNVFFSCSYSLFPQDPSAFLFSWARLYPYARVLLLLPILVPLLLVWHACASLCLAAFACACPYFC